MFAELWVQYFNQNGTSSSKIRLSNPPPPPPRLSEVWIFDLVGLVFPAKFCYFVGQSTNFSRFSDCDVGKTRYTYARYTLLKVNGFNTSFWRIFLSLTSFRSTSSQGQKSIEILCVQLSKNAKKFSQRQNGVKYIKYGVEINTLNT